MSGQNTGICRVRIKLFPKVDLVESVRRHGMIYGQTFQVAQSSLCGLHAAQPFVKLSVILVEGVRHPDGKQFIERPMKNDNAISNNPVRIVDIKVSLESIFDGPLGHFHGRITYWPTRRCLTRPIIIIPLAPSAERPYHPAAISMCIEQRAGLHAPYDVTLRTVIRAASDNPDTDQIR